MSEKCRECPFESLCREIGPEAAHEIIAVMLMIEALAKAVEAQQAPVGRYVGVN